MALPAFSYNGAMPILDVEAMLARLPARTRADVEWVRKPIADGLRRLGTEPLSDELLNEVSASLAAPVLRLGLAFWNALLVSPEEWRALLMQEFEREGAKLAEFLQSPEAEDTLEWVLGYFRSFFSLALRGVGAIAADAVPDLGKPWSEWPNEFRLFLRSETALMAVMSLAKSGGSRERAHELLDRSFLDLNELQAALRRDGWFVTAFPDETTIERRKRLLKSAQFIRDGISYDDWKQFDEARVRNLR